MITIPAASLLFNAFLLSELSFHGQQAIAIQEILIVRQSSSLPVVFDGQPKWLPRSVQHLDGKLVVFPSTGWECLIWSRFMNRVGIGVDVHRFATGRKLILGGVEVPHTHGLEGHSDADALAHAVADALLGALALGDIGLFYPPGDPKCKDMNSMILLRECAERVRKAGGTIQNVDAMIIAQAPKLAPFMVPMQETVARHMGVSTGQVGVKATTSEYMGFAGRKEGVVVVAIASVEL